MVFAVTVICGPTSFNITHVIIYVIYVKKAVGRRSAGDRQANMNFSVRSEPRKYNPKVQFALGRVRVGK